MGQRQDGDITVTGADIAESMAGRGDDTVEGLEDGNCKNWEQNESKVK